MQSAGQAGGVPSIGTDPDVVGPMVPGLVSIVIPCYRGARFLEEAIESCLGQTYSDIEVIVVDDASPDDCAEIAERYARRDWRVRLVRRDVNWGVSRAFNSGFELARGEYFARLAQDDRFREDAIDIMVRHIKAHPDAGLVYCDTQTIDEEGVIMGWSRAADPDEFRADRRCLGVCVLWPRAVWDKVGRFDPEFDTAEDYEYWRRIIKHFPLSKCPDEAPMFFRVHPLQGSNRSAIRQEFAHWNARARHCGSRWEAWRLKGRCYTEVAYIHRRHGRIASTLSCLMASAWYWPFSVRLYKVLAGTIGSFVPRH
jgi:glycosyltransferase involved in cell wall biosynthesis